MSDLAPVSVLVVEDHPLLGEALEALLRRESVFDVVGVVTSVSSALETARRSRPRLIALDQHLPDGKGTDIARALRRADWPCTLVMLTGDASDATFIEAIESGVAGFISKATSATQIVELLKRAAMGEIVIPVADLARVLAARSASAPADRDRARVERSLTPRDRVVLDLLARGRDTREIAERTGLTVNTIRGHVQNVIEKLGTHSRLEALVRAQSLGLVRQS